jgi:hypothetical protein
MKSKTSACSSQSTRPSAARWMKRPASFRSEGFHLFCSTGFARTSCKSSLWHTSAAPWVLASSQVTANKQLERTVIRRHVRAASAPFHYALTARSIGWRAAAQLRR